MKGLSTRGVFLYPWGYTRFLELGSAREQVADLRRGEADGEIGIVTDCSLAALRMKKSMGKRARHPVELLAEAYGFKDEAEVS